MGGELQFVPDAEKLPPPPRSLAQPKLLMVPKTSVDVPDRVINELLVV